MKRKKTTVRHEESELRDLPPARADEVEGGLSVVRDRPISLPGGSFGGGRGGGQGGTGGGGIGRRKGLRN